jgi:aerobic carbon-monoxide dehydrogenase medium subunit
MHSETRFAWSSKLDWEKYLRPRHLSEALAFLEEHRGEARIIAGGTDLLNQIRKKEATPRVLIDITQIPDLDRIKCEEGLIKIGALATHHQISVSPLIREKAGALSQGASWLGSPQIRNLGTVGGNIVSGQPGADVTIPLLALNAKVKVLSKKGERIIPLTDFFKGPGKTVVESASEIVTEVLFPALKEGETSLSLRLAKRKALALPILTASLVLSADLAKKRFHYVNIALGPVAPVPFRAKGAEQCLASAPIREEVIKEAARKAAQESNPRSNPLRGSGAYRKDMVAALVERGIQQGLYALEVQHG